jgi:hypothetical protein
MPVVLVFSMIAMLKWLLLAVLCLLPLPLSAQDTPADDELTLSAHLETEKTVLHEGLIWRIYSDATDGTPARFVSQSTEAVPTFRLPPGAYIVHVTYGLSGTTQRVVLGAAKASETVSINAGALQLNALVGDTPIPANKVRFSIYVAVGTDPEGRLIADAIQPDVPIRLPVGAYRVVSRYGDTNAITSADLIVEPAKLIKATLRHRAAIVTLKLVNKLGGEAYAGTDFSVLTPGGDTIRDLVGAFPSLILAEGDYILIARNNGSVFTQEFKVRSGEDKDVEIVAK